ncbi:hypothetical protein FACS1894139_08230 [Planctomycetales bacterium]|nr:hypothetical protein FACS1894107_00030 [Planctomycetales bacterium]GHS96321.1 hypothetical protein FACS1894108_00750 [Planctomycetales bacterium]GHT05055.1 hypothetical protein FACS1894139_08230 [Planctomycetales bacterium]GHV19370.1 hypothetical protein AGMMS49959_04120 [Planctomycetales bacterium]
MINDVADAETFEDFIRAIRRNKAALLEEHGGLDGLRKYQAEERPLLEAQGWKFVSPEEVAARNNRRQVGAVS